jgi:hypothetical protein
VLAKGETAETSATYASMKYAQGGVDVLTPERIREPLRLERTPQTPVSPPSPVPCDPNDPLVTVRPLRPFFHGSKNHTVADGPIEVRASEAKRLVKAGVAQRVGVDRFLSAVHDAFTSNEVTT